MLNIHRTPFSLKSPSIFSCSHTCNPLRNSRSAPTKFLPLSERMSSGNPHLAINRCRQLINESVSNDSTTSICTALELKQVNRQPYLFSCPRPLLTAMGPKQSIPTLTNAGPPDVTLSGSKSPICCSQGRASGLLHIIHFLKTRLTRPLTPVIQYLRRISATTYSLPECAVFSCVNLTIFSAIRCSCGIIGGSFARLGSDAFFNRPVATITPLTREGPSLCSGLLGETPLPSHNAINSSG